MRICAAPDCDNEVTGVAQKRYCCTRCANRIGQRRFNRDVEIGPLERNYLDAFDEWLETPTMDNESRRLNALNDLFDRAPQRLLPRLRH